MLYCQAKFTFLLGLVILLPGINQAKVPDFKLLEQKLLREPTASNLLELAESYHHASIWYQAMPHFNADSSDYCFDKAIALYKRVQPFPYEKLARIYLEALTAYLPYKEKNKEQYANKALLYCEKSKTKDKLLVYRLLIKLIEQTIYKQNREKSLQLFRKADKLLKKDTSPNHQAIALMMKGWVYLNFNQKTRRECKNYLKKSVALFDDHPNPEFTIDRFLAYYDLCGYYNLEKKWDSCIVLCNKMKALLPLIKQPLYHLYYYTEISNVLSQQSNYAESKVFLLEGKQFAQNTGLTLSYGYQSMLNLLGDVACEEGHYDEAIAYFEEGRKLLNFLNPRALNAESFWFLARAYEKKGDYKTALKFERQYYADYLEEIEAKNKLTVKEHELSYNLLKQEKKLEQQNRIRSYLFILLVMAALLMGLMLWIYLREKQHKAIIEKQFQRLHQLDEAKTRFFANVSHELRTPLTLMFGPLSSVLKNPTLPEKEKKLLQLTQQNAKQLLRLVTEILELSKLESGVITAHEEPTDLYLFLRRLVSTFESYAAQKSINLIFDYASDAPRGLMLDKTKIESIFNNLLFNALKYTPAGGRITIQVQHTSTHWQLRVSDTGRGIHQDDLPKVFDRFFQSNQPDLPIEGGTGIGLTLSKQLVLVMGGNLKVESTLGQGSTFTLELPKREVLGLHQGDSAKESEVEEPFLEHFIVNSPSVREEGKKQILLVEDNFSLRQYLQLILADQYQIFTADNGESALVLLEERAQAAELLPDLIISDIMMPIMDGFQLLQQLKSDQRWGHIPVIALTARAASSDRLHALRIGVDDYLTKPFEEVELLARIRNLLQHAALRQQFQTAANQEKDAVEEALPIWSVEEQAWLEQLENAVHRHIGDYHLSVDTIAEELHISRAQFFRRIQLLTGLTPLEYLQEVRFNHARQLLEERKVSSVKAASAAIGIQKAAYFSAQFKARFGKLPSAYLER